MKITVSQLKKIIKEEILKVNLKENHIELDTGVKFNDIYEHFLKHLESEIGDLEYDIYAAQDEPDDFEKIKQLKNKENSLINLKKTFQKIMGEFANSEEPEVQKKLINNLNDIMRQYAKTNYYRSNLSNSMGEFISYLRYIDNKQK
jgi:predicted RNA-binding protein with EMAP domain